jgi:hypothetical protein
VRKLEEFPVLLRGYEIQSELSDSFAAITSDCCLQVLGFRVYMQQQGLGLGLKSVLCCWKDMNSI